MVAKQRRNAMFVIEDEKHAEPQAGEFSTLAEAISELKRRAALPWDEPPNVAPCTNWRNCGRSYEAIEYDTSANLWRELQRIPVLEVTAVGAKWLLDVVH
jgi:hypothetical protein